MSININVFERMLRTADEDTKRTILFDINRLIDYADFVSKLEDLINQNSESIFITKKLDSDRREKHNMAISCIAELNEISNALGLGCFYDGPVDDENRSVIAQAIYDFSEHCLNFNQKEI